ncbi:MAG TPA: tetratricopeptide repeat protein, partial [Nitrospirales bacterium]|nr:tetratricopeptide repeat protein [Nitrospirales bacterium]
MSTLRQSVSITLALLFSIYGCSSNPEEKKSVHLERGNRYFEAGQYSEAVIEYKNVVQADPADATGHYKLALAYLKLGGIENLQQGFSELTKTVEFNPDLHEAQIRLGELYLLSGDAKTAREKAELVLAREPNNAESTLLLGKSLAVRKEIDRAIETLNKAVELAPRRTETYIDLAVVYAIKGDAPAADRTLRRAIEADPRSIPVHLALGDFSLTQGKIADAEAEYKQAVAIDPPNAALREKLARFYLAGRRLPEAEAVYAELVRLKPQDENALVSLGTFYAITDRYEQAVAAFQKADTLPGASLLPKKKLAALQLSAGKLDDAKKTIHALFEKTDRDPDAIFLL